LYVLYAYSLTSRVLVSFLSLLPRPPLSTLFPYTTLFRSVLQLLLSALEFLGQRLGLLEQVLGAHVGFDGVEHDADALGQLIEERSEEHTSELQSPCNLVCRLLLEKKINKLVSRLPF